MATVEEWFGAVLHGAGVGTEVASAATYYPWPGLAFVPLSDVVPATVALAWRADTTNPLVDEFRLAAREAVRAVGATVTA